MPTAVCEECGKRFYPMKTKRADMIRRAAKSKWTKLGIECANCKEYATVNPTALVADCLFRERQ